MTWRMRSTLQVQPPLSRMTSTRLLNWSMVAVMLDACSAKRASACTRSTAWHSLLSTTGASTQGSPRIQLASKGCSPPWSGYGRQHSAHSATCTAPQGRGSSPAGAAARTPAQGCAAGCWSAPHSPPVPGAESGGLALLRRHGMQTSPPAAAATSSAGASRPGPCCSIQRTSLPRDQCTSTHSCRKSAPECAPAPAPAHKPLDKQGCLCLR